VLLYPDSAILVLTCDTEHERLPFNEGWRPTNILGAFPLAGNVLQLALDTPEDEAPTRPGHRTVGFHGMNH